MTPTLSVVIPVRDDAEALHRCLTLIATQTMPPAEVVVVDNASGDDSAAVAGAHGARVVTEPSIGIPAAAAAGYDAAGGELIVRCDADTRAPRDWLERIGAAFESDPELVALTGRADFYDLPGLRGRLAQAFYVHGYQCSVHAAVAGVPLWGSCLAIRRTAWQQARELVHRDDARIHDDIDLSFARAPGTRVRYDRHLVVGVSGRMFHSRAAARRRFAMAFHTLAVNWARTPPWQRWAERLSSARRRSATASPAPRRRSSPPGTAATPGSRSARRPR